MDGAREERSGGFGGAGRGKRMEREQGKVFYGQHRRLWHAPMTNLELLKIDKPGARARSDHQARPRRRRRRAATGDSRQVVPPCHGGRRRRIWRMSASSSCLSQPLQLLSTSIEDDRGAWLSLCALLPTRPALTIPRVNCCMLGAR
jgi:hypothetical protein